MQFERRKGRRYAYNGKVGIFLAKGEGTPPKSAILTGNLIDISLHGAGLSLPEILDGRVHLAYTAMESSEMILHIILYYKDGQEVILPAKPAWFNRSLSEHLTPFRLGVEFSHPLLPEQLKHLI